MSRLSVRVSAATTRSASTGRTAITPMLPALLRGVIFVTGLAAALAVALLAG
jgi:hypothetical protein